jgi:hypothetical protein
MSFRRLTMSAKAPAGRVKRKKGRDATVEIFNSLPLSSFHHQFLESRLLGQGAVC